MPSGDSLLDRDLRLLKSIFEHFISADYWEDATIKRYRALDLVSCDGKQIHLTSIGERALAEAS